MVQIDGARVINLGLKVEHFQTLTSCPFLNVNYRNHNFLMTKICIQLSILVHDIAVSINHAIFYTNIINSDICKLIYKLSIKTLIAVSI